jgi:alkylation response protein AidB-like acyl-CoA dehydrogenase
MDLDFTRDQEALRASIHDVLARECPIGVVREVVEKGTGLRALWQRFVSLDWPALTVPSDCGGMGLGAVELAVLMEECGASVVPAPLFSTLGLYVPVVRAAGSPSQQRSLLSLVAGGAAGTVAWDPGLPTVSLAGGVLRGTHHYVLDADEVSTIIVPALFGDDVCLAVVPRSEVSAVAVRSLDATRRISSVSFDGVRPASLLGGAGDRRVALARGLEEATTALSVEIVGTCSRMFTIALEYAKVREQFGVKIGSFQAMKHKLADMFVALEAARATAYYAAAAVAEDDPRRSIAASMAKSIAGDCQRHVCAEGIQTLGGIGYTWEHDMHLYVKRAMTSGTLLGDAEFHRGRVAALLGVA